MPAVRPITATVCPRSSGPREMEEAVVVVLMIPPISSLKIAFALRRDVQYSLLATSAKRERKGLSAGIKGTRSQGVGLLPDLFAE